MTANIRRNRPSLDNSQFVGRSENPFFFSLMIDVNSRDRAADELGKKASRRVCHIVRAHKISNGK